MADQLDDGGDAFIKPTTHFWQDILAADDAAVPGGPPYRCGYPARLPDGRCLVLPLRCLPEANRAVASLIANQASQSMLARRAPPSCR